MLHRKIILASLVLVASCGPDTTGRRGGGGHDLAGTGNGDGGGNGDDGGGEGNDLSMSMPADLLQLDGPPGMAYDDLGKSDSGACPMGQNGAGCANPIANNAGCGGVELCGANGTGNGLDDNCDGRVDEGCGCTPGAVEKCFLGPPGKRGVGACTDGTQTCFGAEFGAWGPCQGSIGPQPESCDKLDNDCNGCADDGLCCGSVLDCPGPGDPRIAPAQPYTDVALKGELFFFGAAQSWSWTVVGGPCDQLFSTTTGSPPVQSFTLTGANMQDATVHFTLSGDYTITMTVVGTDGNTYTCTWVQHVIGPGVRFELCWDHTGPSPNGADLDLHVHRSGTTTDWFSDGVSGAASIDDCDYSDCNPDSYAFCAPPIFPCTTPNWGYTASNIMMCSGAPATASGNTWTATSGNCPNPRQDVDNIDTLGRPENTNIDNPKNNDSFRAMVHYYGQDGSSSSKALTVHPIVNIYCNGTLKASYGQSPNQLTGFTQGFGYPDSTTSPPNQAQLWRVADVKWSTAGATPDCTVTAIHPPATMSGYYVTNSGITY